jgi:hypothetical protein
MATCSLKQVWLASGHKKTRELLLGFLIDYAVWTGLEPATSGVTGRHSNQLNYQTSSLLMAMGISSKNVHHSNASQK